MIIKKVSATIRNRGQLTIPDEFREKLSWLGEGSSVHMIATDTEVRITPYVQEAQGAVDWKKLRQSIALARSFKGRGGSLSAFIAKDRYNH